MNQIITLYIFNSQGVVCQLQLNKAGIRKKVDESLDFALDITPCCGQGMKVIYSLTPRSGGLPMWGKADRLHSLVTNYNGSRDGRWWSEVKNGSGLVSRTGVARWPGDFPIWPASSVMSKSPLGAMWSLHITDLCPLVLTIFWFNYPGVKLVVFWW